jgi:hypothetical protein
VRQISELEEKIADFVESLKLNDHQFDTLQGLLVDFRGAVTLNHYPLKQVDLDTP